MTSCFKDHESDKQLLNHNTIPISECKTHVIDVYDGKFEVTEVPILTCTGLWLDYQEEA